MPSYLTLYLDRPLLYNYSLKMFKEFRSVGFFCLFCTAYEEKNYFELCHNISGKKSFVKKALKWAIYSYLCDKKLLFLKAQ